MEKPSYYFSQVKSNGQRAVVYYHCTEDFVVSVLNSSDQTISTYPVEGHEDVDRILSMEGFNIRPTCPRDQKHLESK